MRLNNRLISRAVLLLLLVGALFSCACARAEEVPKLNISLEAQPQQLLSPGEITLTFSLENATDALLESVSLTSIDGTLVETIGDLPSGASQTYARTHAVTEAELNSGAIEYIVTCVSDSEHLSYAVQAQIEKLYPDPEVEFLRQVSSRKFSEGQQITLVYRLHNVGNVAVTDLTVTDPLGDFEAQLDVLEVGASAVFVQSVSLSEAAQSAPTLHYCTESGSDAYTLSLDPMPLEAAQPMLNATLTAGRSMFDSETAEVVLLLSNGGNVDYQNITIYDDVYGGVIADSISLPANGEPIEIAHTYPLREDSRYCWRIVGRTENGETLDMVTQTAAVEANAEGAEPHLTIRAHTDTPKINRRGYISIQIEIENSGESNAASVQIAEQDGETLFELAVVPTGDPTVREIHREITEDCTLVFTAVYTDSLGNEHTAISEPLEIDISASGQSPQDQNGETLRFFGGISTQMEHSGLFFALLIACCAILLVLIAMLIVTSHRARIQRRAQATARKKRIKEEMGKTNPFKPLRVRNQKPNNDP